VPFERVPDLVAQRRAFLWQGWAYLTCRDLASAAAGLFCESISRRLEDHARIFASKISADDERLFFFDWWWALFDHRAAENGG